MNNKIMSIILQKHSSRFYECYYAEVERIMPDNMRFHTTYLLSELNITRICRLMGKYQFSITDDFIQIINERLYL